MNNRKNIDYGQMYAAIDDVVAQQLPQMQLYYSIGKIVCARSEKGAAVMASEYIIANSTAAGASALKIIEPSRLSRFGY